MFGICICCKFSWGNYRCSTSFLFLCEILYNRLSLLRRNEVWKEYSQRCALWLFKEIHTGTLNKCYKIDFSARKCFHEYIRMVSICWYENLYVRKYICSWVKLNNLLEIYFNNVLFHFSKHNLAQFSTLLVVYFQPPKSMEFSFLMFNLCVIIMFVSKTQKQMDKMDPVL